MSYHYDSLASIMKDMSTCKSVEVIANKYQTEGIIGSFVRVLAHQIDGGTSGIVEYFEVEAVFKGEEESYKRSFHLENDKVDVIITKNLTLIEDRHVKIKAKTSDDSKQYNISIELKEGCDRKFVIEKILVNIIRNFDKVLEFYTLHDNPHEN